MFFKRCRIVFVFLVALLAAPSFLAASEPAPNGLPGPLVCYVSASSPKRMTEVADKLFLAILKGTENAGAYQPGMFPGLAASINIPSLFENSEATLGLALVINKQRNPEVAFILKGVDKAAFVQEMARGGIPASEQSDSVYLDFTAIHDGLTLHLMDVDGGRLLLVPEVASGRRFAKLLGRFDPEHSRDTDVRARIDVKRLRALYPEDIQQYIAKIDGMGQAEIEKSLSSNLDAQLRAGIARASAEVVRRFAPLPLEMNAVDVDLSVSGDILELTFTAAVEQGGILDGLAARYAALDNPSYTLTGTVSDDAIVLSADSPVGGWLFPEGDIVSAIGSIFFDSLVPERADAAEALRRAYRENPVSEEVSGYYMRDGSLVRVKFVKTGNGKQYIDTLVETAELANAALERVNASIPKGHTLVMTTDSGKADKLAYRFIAPRATLADDDPELVSVRDYINGIGCYLASNKSAVMMVSGQNIDPADLKADTARLTPGIDNALMEYDVAVDLERRFSKRQLGHCFFKPSDIFVYFTWYRIDLGILELPANVDGEAYLDSLQNGGDLAGYGLGAVPGGLVFKLALPLEALNDFFVNIEKEQALDKAVGAGAGTGAGGGDVGDEDDWGE